MSYIRPAHPLRYFDDISKEFVFLSVGRYDSGLTTDKSDNKDFVEDYDTTYSHLPSFIELIGNIIERETNDDKYAFKIVSILAERLNVKMRNKKLDDDEYDKIMMEHHLGVNDILKNKMEYDFPNLNETIKFSCGHEGNGFVHNANTLKEYVDWSGTVGFYGNKSKCFKCWKGK